jgi:hypothetical protein
MPFRHIIGIALPLVVSTHASAQGATAPPHVPTHEWGCEVLLCLANPAGPTAVAACVPPIHHLWRELAKGHAFPSCAEASGTAGRSYAQPVESFYDPCPEGSTELPAMNWAELTSPMTTSVPAMRSGMPSSYRAAAYGVQYLGVAGSETPPTSVEAGDAMPKMCVANHVDDRLDWSGDISRTVGRYQTIWTALPSPSPRAIDVYIDDVFWGRVRY